MTKDKTSMTLENALRFTFHPHGVRDFYVEMYEKDPKMMKIAKTMDVVKYAIPIITAMSSITYDYILK